MTEVPQNRQPLFVAGVVALILALGYFVFVRDDDGGDTGCTLTAAGLASVGLAMSRGHTTAEVVSVVGEPIANDACKRMVNSLLHGDSASAKIKTNNGYENRRFSLPDLTDSVPQSSLDRMLRCRGWTSPLLFKMCTDGHLDPISQ